MMQQRHCCMMLHGGQALHSKRPAAEAWVQREFTLRYCNKVMKVLSEKGGRKLRITFIDADEEEVSAMVQLLSRK